MFKLYPIDFREFPYIDIKIGEGCPAACTDCKFNIDYIYKPKQFSLDNILNRIKTVDKYFDKKFNLVFGNQDALNHVEIFDILEAGLSTGRDIRFQIDFNIKKNHLTLLKEIESRFGNERIYVKIAQNCRGVENLSEKLVILLRLLSKETNLKFYLDLFLDFETNSKLINYFHKNFGQKNSDNVFSYIIGGRIELKFHNYSWKLDRKNKCISNLERSTCQQLEQLYCLDNNIFLKDSIDVYDNGDMFIHDNLCNIGDIRISNLFLDKNIMYEHFVDYINHLNLLKDSTKTQSEMCYKCITNGFKYKK